MRQLLSGPGLVVRDDELSWAREDVWAAMRGAGKRIAAQGLKVRVLDISKRGGGRLKPHVSHRDGRDADVQQVSGARPAENPAVLAFVRELAPSLERVGSTFPMAVTGVTISRWDGHTKHVHLRWPTRTISQRLTTAAARAYDRPHNSMARKALVAASEAALLALDGAPDDANAIALATARAAIAKLAAGELVDGPAAAKAIRAFVAIVKDVNAYAVQNEIEALASVTLEDVAEGVSKVVKNTAFALLLPLLWLALPVVGVVVVVGVIVLIVRGLGSSSSSSSSSTELDELTDPELRSLYASATRKPPGRRSRERLAAELGDLPDLDEKIAAWKS